MEIIEELEPERRGLYAGAVGYFDYHGNMDTCIAIRTLLVEGRQRSRAGGRRRSSPTPSPSEEYEETLHKAAGAAARDQRVGGEPRR